MTSLIISSMTLNDTIEDDTDTSAGGSGSSLMMSSMTLDASFEANNDAAADD